MGLSRITSLFPVVGQQNQRIIIVSSILTVILFVVGIIIGYFSFHPTDKTDRVASIKAAIVNACGGNGKSSLTEGVYLERYAERHYKLNECARSASACWDFELPRNYIAYHLNGESINIDGKLNDSAWNNIPWSESFVDMRSEIYPKPRFDTKFKIRWDDEYIYVGAMIEETNLWATFTKHDSGIWRENGFEMLLDVDGSLFNYKQWQINVLGTMMDLIMYKSPYDYPWKKAANISWHANAKKAIYTDGTINNPDDNDAFWSVEVAVSFKDLKDNSSRVKWSLDENEVWFVQFGRSEQELIVLNGTYQRIFNSRTAWWSWQPCDTISLHLQDRWGLVQFKKDMRDKTFRSEKWHIYKALFDMMDAMKTYKAINGKYTTNIEELDVPPYLLSRTCVDIPKIKLTKTENKTDFDVSVSSMLFTHLPGHIRSDKYVSFHN